MSKIKFCLFSVILILLFLSGCRKASDSSGTVTADHIKYRVSYMEDMAGDIPTRMLPEVMNAYYTDQYVMTEIEGFFGQFSLIQIADLRKKTVATLLHFFGNKVYYKGKRGEIPVGIVALESPKVTYSEDTVTICGMLSKKAIVKTPESTYDIYYIEDVDVKSPNIATPYYFIDHVLSDFRVQLSYLKMHLEMYEHQKEEIDASVFSIPEDYEDVSSRESMESIINTLFTKE